MAIKFREEDRRKMELTSLIDMVFILLVFFLVTVTVVQLTVKEQKLPVPTPISEPGRAQILIQLLADGRFLWIDDQATSIVSRIMDQVEKTFGYLSPRELENKKTHQALRVLLNKNIFPGDLLESKLDRLISKANKTPSSQYFILLRVPDSVPYYHIIDIIQKLSRAKFHNISYGCVGGSIAQIRNSKNVKVVIEKDKHGRRRENLRIDF